MERLKQGLRALGEKVRAFFASFRPAPSAIRDRWLLTVLLPVTLIVTAAVIFFAVYVRIILGAGAKMPVIFACAVGVALVLAIWLLGVGFIHGVTDSLARLRHQAQRISEGSFRIRTEKLRDDELGDLTDSINEMSEELARANALQSEFISSVSHELRTPLTAIMGWTEAMSYDEAIQGDSRRGLEIIGKEAGRLTKMVTELLEFTRIQDGRFNLNIETMDIAAEVEDAVFTYRNLMEQEGLELVYTCEEDEIPEIQGDPERLKQVLLNVLDNAAKYGKSGGRVEVSVTAGEGEVSIAVRDHGPGIPENELPHVKERFYKGSSKERGSGIGLAVCEEIVTRHGGALLIENAGDDGLLVTVRLPEKQK